MNAESAKLIETVPDSADILRYTLTKCIRTDVDSVGRRHTWLHDDACDLIEEYGKAMQAAVRRAQAEADAAIADSYGCWLCGMDGKCGAEIRRRAGIAAEEK